MNMYLKDCPMNFGGFPNSTPNSRIEALFCRFEINQLFFEHSMKKCLDLDFQGSLILDTVLKEKQQQQQRGFVSLVPG